MINQIYRVEGGRFEGFDDDALMICGEWRSPMATHEFSVHVIEQTKEWRDVDLIEYGEWGRYDEEAARSILPPYIVAEIDSAIERGAA